MNRSLKISPVAPAILAQKGVLDLESEVHGLNTHYSIIANFV